MQVVFIKLKRVFKLAITQQAVIDENTRLPLADRLVHEHRRDGRIDAARQSANDIALGPDSLADLFDLFLNKLSRCPIAFAVANFEIGNF